MSMKQAVEQYEQAAAQGHADALFNLGAVYEHGAEGVPKDVKKAVKWYEQAAARGHSGAVSRLANIKLAQGRVSV